MKMICFLICCHFTIFRDACLARILVRRLNKLAFVYTVCMLWKLLWTFRDLALRKHNINDSQIIRAVSVSGHGCFPCDEIEKQKQWHIVADSVQTEGGMSSNYNWVIERWLSVAKYGGVWGVVGREWGVVGRERGVVHHPSRQTRTESTFPKKLLTWLLAKKFFATNISVRPVRHRLQLTM